MELDYLAVQKKLREFILQDGCTQEQFEAMAGTVFAFQYNNNIPYQKYCKKRRVSPATIKSFRDIPPVPITIFKETELACCPEKEAQAVFMTSGTTNAQKRGKNIHRDLEIYDLSMEKFFKACILPDLERIKMAVLFPPEKEMPNSSLAHYLGLAKDKFGAGGSRYFVSKDGFQREEFKGFLAAAKESTEPVLVIGATFSFIHFLDHCLEAGIRYQLSQGSRIMDTGGAKSRSREIKQQELKQALSRLFGVPEYACVNMYGMTELSSQFYDLDLRKHYLEGKRDSRKVAPHWVRTVVVDPETMEEKREGEKGILIHYDLANLNSVLAIMTEDVGVEEGNGFHLLGRVQGAESKGCSLAVEQFIAGEAV